MNVGELKDAIANLPDNLEVRAIDFDSRDSWKSLSSEDALKVKSAFSIKDNTQMPEMNSLYLVF